MPQKAKKNARESVDFKRDDDSEKQQKSARERVFKAVDKTTEG